MIQEDGEDEPIDFSWFYFIGRTKLGLTDKQIGRLTMTLFNKYYDHYKNTFDFEMLLKTSGTTYQKAYDKAHESDEWF